MLLSTQNIRRLNFNPRSHEGSDHGVTVKTVPDGYFNPRSHEGSDVCTGSLCFNSKYFNPRSHEGSDE